MTKQFTSLGFMSGTSMDGLDASIIQSDGVEQYKELINTYIEYEPNMRKKITELRDKINNSNDLDKYIKDKHNIDVDGRKSKVKMLEEFLEKKQ